MDTKNYRLIFLARKINMSSGISTHRSRGVYTMNVPHPPQWPLAHAGRWHQPSLCLADRISQSDAYMHHAEWISRRETFKLVMFQFDYESMMFLLLLNSFVCMFFCSSHMHRPPFAPHGGGCQHEDIVQWKSMCCGVEWICLQHNIDMENSIVNNNQPPVR